MLASLPMYDLPEARDATDGYWNLIAKSLSVDMPLTRGEDWTAPWRDSQLLLSQTCGYPYTHEFAGQLTYVATPHFAADGCEGPNYRSIIFSRENCAIEDLRNTTTAVNSPDSMSGMLALKLMFETPTLRHSIVTGSHAASLRAVQTQLADVCAIDCVTVALLRKYRPSALEGLVEIARSPAVPGLPYVTRSFNVEKLQRALAQTLSSPAAKALLIEGFTVLPSDAYNIILRLEASLHSVGRN